MVDQIDALRNAFTYVHRRHPFVIEAIVVLPDHLHAIWRLPLEDSNYPSRWRLIKTHFSHAMPRTEFRSESRIAKGERGIWQRRYWEHLIRNDNDYARHVDYIHFNPVKHGHVARVCEWPYSSFHRYVRSGILNKDWAGDAREFEGGFGE